jgi:hypothetical protein
MEPIRVPRPPKEAFQKNRPVSDLLLSQIKHFQHVEAKLDPALRTKFAPHEVVTENAAAQYIAQMTRTLRGVAAPAAVGLKVVPGARKSSAPEGKGLALAAGAAVTKKTTASKRKKKS